MRFIVRQRAGRQESEKLEEIGITCQKKAVLILAININMGGKRAKEPASQREKSVDAVRQGDCLVGLALTSG